MAANSHTLADEDHDFSDWIEIYNPTDAPIDLAGWHLTDRAANLAEWTFPTVEIDAGARMVVFASGKNRAEAGGQLHTNFKLNGDGEYLALVRPDLSIANEFAPTYPDQVPDVSYGVGSVTTISTALPTGAAATAYVPNDDSLGMTWTSSGFDDSQWNDALARNASRLAITEAGPGAPSFVELQNVSAEAVDTTGWVVAIGAGDGGDINAANATFWNLPASVPAGAILYRTDDPGDNYWGSDITWQSGGSGWVMIVDGAGNVVDFAAWGYTEAQISELNLTAGGHAIGGTADVVPVDYEYEGNPAVAHGISPSYPDLTGTLLTDGNLGTNDWRSGYVGSQEPTAEGNSGRLQPRVSFDLGANYNLRSATITYMVDQSAGIYAPDSVAVSVSTTGLDGTYGGTVVSTAFDDSPDGNPTTYFGAVRTLTVDLGGVSADAVRLDFLNDGQWTFLSEVSFVASSANVGWRGDGAAADATVGLSLSREGTGDHNLASDFFWSAATLGQPNAALTAPFPIPPVVTGLGYERGTGFEGQFATDLDAAMYGRNTSVFLRVPFSISASDMYAAQLRMKYDGGFVAYLNGQEIARRNAPASLTWDSAATASRFDADAITFETIDLPLSAPLPVGQNVLAIWGLNDSETSSSFLLAPELDVASLGSAEANLYFASPTPGAANSTGLGDLTAAPVLSQDSGVYSQSFSLTIDNGDPLSQIRYTINGAEPTASATLYAGPISIAASSVVKARAFHDGRIASPIRQGSYVMIDPALATRDSDVPLVIIDSLSSAIPGGGSWASLVTALIDTDATGRSHITDTPDFIGRGGLHLRGSSSLSWPKKNLTFETWDAAGNDLAVPALGFPAESDWVLYASYLDRTLIRDALVYELSNQYGQYGVRTRPVEVYLNTGGGTISEADYLGVYIFEERIKRDDNRVDIAKLNPSDATEPDISGGYMLKIDRGVATIPAALSRDFVPIDPADSELTPAQRSWITNYIADFEAALSGPQFADPLVGYAKYIDVDAWIDYHIMTEVSYNVDEWYLSTYLFKDRGGKLTLGPFWDFDRSLGNTSQAGGAGTTGWWSDALVDFFAAYNNQPREQVVEYPWFRRLFEDPNFTARYVDRYQELRRTTLSEENIFATTDRMAAERAESAVRNEARWGTLNTLIAPSPLAFSTYQQHVDNLKSWISGRLTWIDSQYVPAPEFTPPAGVVAPGTDISMQVPGVPTFVDTVLFGENAQVRSLVPADGSLAATWTGGDEPFDDSVWTAGQNGVGYENFPGVGVSYESYIHVTIPSGTPSSYMRAAFDVSDPDAFGQLVLRMRYDDGFVAYLNGVEVARANAPAAVTYNSGATTLHDDSAAVVFQDFDISAARNALVAGPNVLAIQGLNYLLTSSDYLIQFAVVGREQVPAGPLPIPIYYTTDGTDPRLPHGVGDVVSLVLPDAAARARVPTADVGATWRNVGFDDSAWTSGTTGVGYEKNPADPINYASLIGLDVRSQIDPVAGGANEYKGVYVRVPFAVSDLAAIGSLRLKMKYDDGFVAYLNGTEVARANAPATAVWNSQATAANADTAAVVYEMFDITAFKTALLPGNNILAIHGLGSSIVDSDMLILPELESVNLLGGISPSATLYSGPIAIDDNQRFIARAFDGTRWSGPTDATYVVFEPTLRVSELHYHPAGPTLAETTAGFTDSDDFEFIELINTGTSAINLAGTSFSEGIQFTFGDESLAAGERIVLAANQAAFTLRYGAGVRLAGEYGATPSQFRFSNGGEQVTLVGPLLEPIQSFTYDDAWYPSTDGDGYSLIGLNLASSDTTTWDQPAGWRASFEFGGSPGERDRIRGDLNEDDRVDLFDLVVLQQHLGIASGAVLGNGDANRDGAVDRADAAIVAANFGRAYQSPVASAAAAEAVVSRTNATQTHRALTAQRRVRRGGRAVDAMVNGTTAIDAPAVDHILSGESLPDFRTTLRAARSRFVPKAPSGGMLESDARQ